MLISSSMQSRYVALSCKSLSLVTEIAIDASQEGIHIAYLIRFCTLGINWNALNPVSLYSNIFTSFGHPHNFVYI